MKRAELSDYEAITKAHILCEGAEQLLIEARSTLRVMNRNHPILPLLKGALTAARQALFREQCGRDRALRKQCEDPPPSWECQP
jgi:hypothetical protein